MIKNQTYRPPSAGLRTKGQVAGKLKKPTSKGTHQTSAPSKDEVTLSEWDAKTGKEKLLSSAFGGWVGLGLAAAAGMVLTAPLSAPITLGLGALAGVVTTQLKARLSPSESSKKKLGRKSAERLRKPSAWKKSSNTDKLANMGVGGVLGATVAGGLALVAGAVASPVILGVGAAVGVAGTVGVMKGTQDFAFDLGAGNPNPTPSGTMHMTRTGRHYLSLGNDLYRGSDGTISKDYGGHLIGLDGKDNGYLQY